MESAGDFVLGVQGSPAIVMLRCLHLSKCLETEPTQTQLWSARVSKFTDRLKTEVHRGGGQQCKTPGIKVLWCWQLDETLPISTPLINNDFN
jgi:hypothetical protein